MPDPDDPLSYLRMPFMDPALLGQVSFQASQGGAGGAPRPAEAVPEADGELQRLLSSLQQPVPKIKKPGVGRKLLAGLADALQTRASVIGGGGPVSAASDKLRAQFQTDVEQQQQIQQANEATRRALVIDAFQNQKQLTQKQAEDIAQEERLRKRQEIDDARDSSIQDKQNALREFSDLLEKGYKPPKDFDIRTANHAAILNQKALFFSEQTGDPELGKALATVDTLMKQRPGLELGGFSVSSEGKISAQVRPREAAKPRPIVLTPGIQKEALEAGITLFDEDGRQKSAEEVTNVLAGFKKEQMLARQKEREAKLNKTTERGTAVRTDIVAQFNIINSAQEALDYIETNPEVGGPYTGRVPYLLQPATGRIAQEEMNNKLSLVSTEILSAKSGKAVTEQEFQRYEPILPLLTDRDTKRRLNLASVIKHAQSIINGRAAAFKITREDIEAIRDSMLRDPNFVPSESRDGDLQLGDR